MPWKLIPFQLRKAFGSSESLLLGVRVQEGPEGGLC